MGWIPLGQLQLVIYESGLSGGWSGAVLAMGCPQLPQHPLGEGYQGVQGRGCPSHCPPRTPWVLLGHLAPSPAPDLDKQPWGSHCRRGNRGTEPGWLQHPPHRGGRMPEQEATPWRHGRGPGASRVSLRPRVTAGQERPGIPPRHSRDTEGFPAVGGGCP